SISTGSATYNYKYQGQERQDELGLNWDSFKWRNYDYAIGRFMSIDPLAEDYSYQGPYNFSENRVIDAFELEGLEAVIIADYGNKLKGDFGHAMVALGTGQNTIVYTYGRYGEVGSDKGPLNGTNLSGEGVLIKLTGDDALNEISKYVDGYGAQVFQIGDANELDIAKFFDDKLSSSNTSPSKGKYKDSDNAKVIDEYNLLDNNCTTITIDGIEAGLKDGALDYNKKNVYGVKSNVKINSVDPAKLNQELHNATKDKDSNIKNVTDDYKK
ncbi:RHS repeat-associated core domain-containing protein, partial [uncultured Weeksella sp.]|uniref:RHS repeat-associated core domain-containing protein n=1 Tax=uncultured Weeksella sp. TaxID=1161389 RepID=UPI00259BEC84